MAKRKKAEKPPPDPRIGHNVRYYSEGWYHGCLEEVKGQTAIIRPIGGGAQQRVVRIPLEDVELITDWMGRR